MSHNRNDSEGDGLPIRNVEFATPNKPESGVEPDTSAQLRWQQQYQQHARHMSGGSLDSDAAAEYWRQWQQYYAAYGYSFPTSQGYQSYEQYAPQPHHQQQQNQQQQPSQQQQYLLPPQNQQQYVPWPGRGAGYAVPVSQGGGSKHSPSNHSSPGSQKHSTRKSVSAPSSPKPHQLFSQPNQEYEPPSDTDAKDVYAALLQGVGPSSYGSTTAHHHQKTNSRGSLNDSSAGIRNSNSVSSSPKLEQPPQPPRRSSGDNNIPSHQRSKSDPFFPTQQGKKPIQRNSSSNGLPTDPALRRPRSSSRGHSGSRTHRRTSSYASSGGVSVSSMVSIVSDIRKSAFYSENHEAKTNGRIQLNFPSSYVHLGMSKSKKLRLFQVAVDQEQYEAYHRVADESFSWLGDDDDDEDDLNLDLEYSSPPKKKKCQCQCPNCTSCQNKQKFALGPNYYLLTVPDNLYRSVVDEICASRSMPCGLFFCGHHEDVSRPSIGIATAIVLILFGTMAFAAYILQA